MRKRLIIIIGLILVIFISLVILDSLRKRAETKLTQQKPSAVEVEEKLISTPLDIKKEKTGIIKIKVSSSLPWEKSEDSINIQIE